MPDSLRRGLRTFFQGVVGVVVLQGVALAADANDGSLDTSLWKRVGVTAAVAGVIAAASYLQNLLEDHDKVPKMLKG